MHEPKEPPSVKAYENLDFMHSPQAREVRILAEFTEPRFRLRKAGVDGTIVFFGSARTPSTEDAQETVTRLEAQTGVEKELAQARALLALAQGAYSPRRRRQVPPPRGCYLHPR